MLPLFFLLLLVWSFFQVTTGKISGSADLVSARLPVPVCHAMPTPACPSSQRSSRLGIKKKKKKQKCMVSNIVCILGCHGLRR